MIKHLTSYLKKPKRTYLIIVLVYVIYTLIYFPSVYAQNLEPYMQYSLEFKSQEKIFIQELKQSNPDISKPEINERLRQFYRENFRPNDLNPAANAIFDTKSDQDNLSSKNTLASTSSFNQVPDDIEYMALRAFFEATDGPNWFDKTGWDYPNWKDPSTVTSSDLRRHGVLVSNGDVITIAPYNNNLSGSIGQINLTGLDQLRFLQMNNNNLTGNIDDLNLSQNPNLESIILYNNNIQGDIGAWDLSSVNALTTLELTNNLIEGDIDQFDLSGNSGVVGIYLSLNNIQGEIHNWNLTGNNEIGAIDISNNSVTGQIHQWDISSLDGYSLLGAVAYIYLANNSIQGDLNLWSAVGYVPLNELSVSDNKLTFANILPFAQSTPISNFVYSPQKQIDVERTVLFGVGDLLTLESNIDRATTPLSSYQWFKNGQAVTGQDPGNHTFNKVNFQVSDGGEYYYTITNSALPDLILQSKVITVENGTEPPTVTDVDICSGQSASLSVTGPGTVNWYTEETGGTSFHTGSSYTTPVLSETTTYYVSQTISGIESERVSITANVGPIFNAAQDQSICRGDAVPIFVDGENLTVDWGENFGNQTSFVARPEVTTTYNYTVNDAFGCSTAGSILITVYESLEANIFSPEPTCLGEIVTLEAEEVAGASYTWEPGGLTGRAIDITLSEV
ncbi:MAG: BspA family leucine-rich repeat surface protein, partial [Bacteroidota bacterium]